MKKGKFLTALLACSMSVVAATACAFTVGCNKDNGNDDGGDNTGHVHQWATTWSHDDTNHWHACTAEGHTGAHKDVAPHVYDNDQDTTCNTCDYVRTVNGGGQEPDPGPGPAVKETVVWNVDDNFTATTVTEEVELKAGMGVYAGKDLVFEASKGKKLTYKGTEVVETTNRVKFNGDGDITKKYLHVKVEADATVIVYAWSGTGGAPAYLKMLGADGNAIGNAQQVSDGTNSVAWATMFSVKANTDYYIVSDSTAAAGAKNAIFNYVAVDYDFKEMFTPVEAKEPECEVDGHYAHSVSDYGRYKNENGELVSRNSIVRAKLNHSYSLKADSITAPTATETGSATLTCANGHETPVELPVLSSDRYTARPEAGVTGNYVITVNGVQITFEAVGVGQKETTYTDVYKLDANAIAVLDNEVTSKAEGQNCVYRKCYTSGSNSYSGSMDPTNAKGLYVGDTSTRTDVRIALGTPISAGIVKISGTIEAGTVNSKWRFFQLHGSETPDAEAFSFGLNENKKLQCWNGSAYVGTEASAAYSANTAINFEILIDLTAKKVTVKFNNVVVAEDQTYGANDLSEIGLSVNDKRSVILHNVTIATQD